MPSLILLKPPHARGSMARRAGAGYAFVRTARYLSIKEAS